jgi:hypothetical protein
MDSYDDEYAYRFSFPLGTPIVVYGLCAVLITSRHWWWWIFGCIALVFAVAFTWEAFSRKEYESVAAKDSSMNLATWRFNWLVFFALPGYAIALYSAWKRWA